MTNQNALTKAQAWGRSVRVVAHGRRLLGPLLPVPAVVNETGANANTWPGALLVSASTLSRLGSSWFESRSELSRVHLLRHTLAQSLGGLYNGLQLVLFGKLLSSLDCIFKCAARARFEL